MFSSAVCRTLDVELGAAHCIRLARVRRRGTGNFSYNPARSTNRCGCFLQGTSMAYLRREAAQGTFVNFHRVVDTTRVKIQFRIAQMGKLFRNEMTPTTFIFRSREFEQMDKRTAKMA
jgi:hypothetical protein